MLDISVELF